MPSRNRLWKDWGPSQFYFCIAHTRHARLHSQFTHTQKRAGSHTHIHLSTMDIYLSFQIASSVTFNYIGINYATELCFPKYSLCLAWESVPVPIYTQTVKCFYCIVFQMLWNEWMVWNKLIILYIKASNLTLILKLLLNLV